MSYLHLLDAMSHQHKRYYMRDWQSFVQHYRNIPEVHLLECKQQKLIRGLHVVWLIVFISMKFPVSTIFSRIIISSNVHVCHSSPNTCSSLSAHYTFKRCSLMHTSGLCPHTVSLRQNRIRFV